MDSERNITEAEFERRINSLKELLQLRYNDSQKALETALTANDRRLDSMNEFRATLSDQASRMISRTEVETLSENLWNKANSQIMPLSEKMESMRQTNYPLIGAFITAVIAAVASIWVIVGLKIDATSQPVLVSIESNKTDSTQLNARMRSAEERILGSTQADSVSSADRLQLNDRVRSLEAAAVASTSADATSRADRSQLNERLRINEAVTAQNTNEQRASATTANSKLVEIETQFKGMSDFINTSNEMNDRWIGVIYNKVFPGQKYPVTTFRPNLYRDAAGN